MTTLIPRLIVSLAMLTAAVAFLVGIVQLGGSGDSSASSGAATSPPTPTSATAGISALTPTR